LIINELKALLGKDVFLPFSNELVGVDLDKKNFKTIDKKEASRIACIDGGCLTIADGGSWIISKIRIGTVEYDGLKKTRQEAKEYYLIIVQKEKYEVVALDNNVPINLKLRGVDSCKIEELASKIMKYFEWQECLNQKTDSLILMDSALNAETEFEKELVDKVLEKKISVIGFCKTSRIRTINGRSLLGVVNSISPKKTAWFYYPIFENEKIIKSFIAKLDDSSKFCYKVELPNYSNPEKIFSILRFFSKDSEMPGYPYPLFKADKLARINSFEKKKELYNIENELKKNDLFFDALSNSFHSELDNRMYRKQ